ncbi:hypothetical protein [Pseudodesulfovibrio karagichevae]|uniref:DUF4145 domain-containing protein n=1 Tax=Pseudodesulfovibrio karagichevae TaxID=3239305 RepID=A0ABV4K430_9BACT
MNLSIFENAKSYLSESLEKAVAAQDDVRQWKFAISNLVQATELFFKARLQMEHKWLIYEDVDKRKRSVSIGQAANRLNALCQLNIDYGEGNKNKPTSDLLLAVRCRNDVTHGGFSIETEQVYLFFRILNYISYFCDSQFNLSVKTLCSTSTWNKIISDKEHIQEQRNSAAKLIDEKSYTELIECPICGFETFVVDQGTNTCFTCQHKEYAFYCENCERITLESELNWDRDDENEICNECWYELCKAQEMEDYLMDQKANFHLHDKD